MNLRLLMALSVLILGSLLQACSMQSLMGLTAGEACGRDPNSYECTNARTELDQHNAKLRQYKSDLKTWEACEASRSKDPKYSSNVYCGMKPTPP
jgi:hypothetical protein